MSIFDPARGEPSYFPGRQPLQSRTSAGAPGQSPPNWHAARESAWAQRLRAERQRSQHAARAADDPPTSELNGNVHEEATADVAPPSAHSTTFAAHSRPTRVPSSSFPQAARPVDPQPQVASQNVEPIRKDAEPVVERLRDPVRIGPTGVEKSEAHAEEVELPREITSGSLLGHRYLLGRLLGAGGGSLIFQAEDRRRIGAEDFGNKIAIKVLRPEMRHNSHALTRLKREFRQMQRLTHPGIARVFEIACDEDIWFMTMELIEGQTINQWLKSGASHPSGLSIINALCDAVAAAHEGGVVHGDLKPSNVLVLPNGGVKLVDFGSAAERDTTTGEIDKDRSFAATPPYASPQVLAGEIADPRDDIFSLACLTYAVLTRGDHPFDRKSSAEAQQTQMKPAYSRSLLPRQFEVIVRALAWERDQRPASVREFLHALLASDLRRDAPKETQAAAPDVISKPLANLSAGDEPTISAKAAVGSAGATREIVPRRTDAPRVAPPAPDRQIKHEDITRLKAALAEAEAHAERIEQTPKPDKPESDDPLTRFKGYVAGPHARSEDDETVGALLRADESPAAEQKSSKRVWPWHRSAWVIALAIAGGGALLAARLDVSPEPLSRAEARPALVPSVAAPTPASITNEAPTVQTAQTAAPVAEEKKSAPVAVKPKPAAATGVGEVTFATRTLHVGVGQTMAALTVKRSNSARGRARVSWTIDGGTARPGVDYQVGNTSTIEFLEGQTVRSLFIPLVAEKNNGEARQSKTFTVKLQPVSGGPKLGEIKQVYVTIVGDVADQRVASAE